MTSDIDQTFDALLAHTDLEIRDLFTTYPDQHEKIRSDCDIFIKNLTDTIKQIEGSFNFHGESGVRGEVPEHSSTLGDGFNLEPFSSQLSSYDAISLPATANTPSQSGQFEHFDSPSMFWQSLPSLVGSPITTDPGFMAHPHSYQNQEPFRPSRIPAITGFDACEPAPTMDPFNLDQPHVDSYSRYNSNDEFLSQRPSATSIDTSQPRKSKRRLDQTEVQIPRKRLRRLEPRVLGTTDRASESSRSNETASLPLDWEDTTGFKFNLLAKDYRYEFDRIFRTLQKRMPDKVGVGISATDLKFMTYTILSTASPAAFQLGETLDVLRDGKSFQAPKSPLSVYEIVKRLISIQAGTMAHTIQRRFYLVKLAQEYACMQKDFRAKRERDRASHRHGGEAGKITTLALNAMTRQAYRLSKDRSQRLYDRQITEVKIRKSLQNGFIAAKCWKTIADTFSIDILAIVMTGELFHMQDQRLEYLPEANFAVFMEVLKEEKGSLLTEIANTLSPNLESILEGNGRHLKFKFESMSMKTPSNGIIDIQTLLKECQLVGSLNDSVSSV